jgi:hypothetical protein
MWRCRLLLCAAFLLAATPPRVADLDGNLVDFASADAKATVLLFVAVDCPISNRYAPEINRLERAFAPRGVSFFLVYTEPSLDATTARRHTADFEITIPALLDREHTLVRHTGVEVTPEAAVLSRVGEVLYRGRIDDRWVEIGTRRPRATRYDLEAALEAILAGSPPQPAPERAVGCYIEPL